MYHHLTQNYDKTKDIIRILMPRSFQYKPKIIPLGKKWPSRGKQIAIKCWKMFQCREQWSALKSCLSVEAKNYPKNYLKSMRKLKQLDNMWKNVLSLWLLSHQPRIWALQASPSIQFKAYSNFGSQMSQKYEKIK